MPSYTLENWDGHLSKKTQQPQDGPSTSTLLSFGPPIRLLGPSEPKDLQHESQPNFQSSGQVDQRVNAGQGEVRSSDVPIGGYTLSSNTDNYRGPDITIWNASHHVPPRQESQTIVEPMKEGRNEGSPQYARNMYGLHLEREPKQDVIITDKMASHHFEHGGMKPGVITAPRDTPTRILTKTVQGPNLDHPEPNVFSTQSFIQPEDHPPYTSPPNSPFSGASSQFDESALFTPPPQGPPTHSLFTPSPPPTRRRRHLFFYVEVPGFPKGLKKTDYTRMVQKKKTKRSPPDGVVHQSIVEALQASWGHNMRMNIPERSGNPNKITIRNPPDPLRSNTLDQSGKPFKITPRNPLLGNVSRGGFVEPNYTNATAGPSSTRLPTNSTSLSHRTLTNAHRKHGLVNGNDRVMAKPPQQTLKPSLKPPTTLKHTIKHSSRTQAQRQGEPNTDRLHIPIHPITPISLTVHEHNSRFIRAQLRNENYHPIPDIHYPRVVKIGNYRGKSWFPWPPPKLGYQDQVQDEISLGAHWELWEEGTQNTKEVPTLKIPPHISHKGAAAAHIDLTLGESIIEISPDVTPVEPTTFPNPNSPFLNPTSPFSNPASSPISSTTTPPSQDNPLHQPEQFDSSVSSNIILTDDSYGDESIHTPQPSAKALGKRRALNEELEPQVESPFLIPSHSPSPEAIMETYLSDPSRYNEHGMDPYLHTLGLVHPQFDPDLIHFNPATSTSPERPLRDSNSLLSSISPSHLYKPHEPIDASIFAEQRHPSPLPGFLILPDFDHGASSWVAGGSSGSHTPDLIESYGNGTIDPSLLGGNLLVEDVVPSSPPPPHPHTNFANLSHTSSHSNSHQSLPSGSQSPAASPYSSYAPSLSSLPPPQSGSNRSTPSNHSYDNSKSRLSQIFTRPRREVRRLHQNMTAIEDLDLSLSEWSDGDEGTFTKKKRSIKQSQAPTKNGKRRLIDDWPRESVDSYCHQCRNKTFIIKAVCDVCTKRYCARCLTTRYGEKPESYDAIADFACPFCDDTCTCDVCTRKRGETYNRIKSAGKSTLPQGPQRSPKLDKTKRYQPLPSVPPKAVTVSGPITYWAAMYDLTGQKIGTAFVGGDGKEDVVVVRRRGYAPRRRVFIGAVQPSWGLGDSPIIKDLEPVVDKNPGRGRKRLREYIGNEAVLRLPIVKSARRIPADVEASGSSIVANPHSNFGESFASPLSSLSSLGDSDGEGGEGECCERPIVYEADFGIAAQGGLDHFLEKGPGVNFSPNSLEDLDVVRAISLALRACGVVVQI